MYERAVVVASFGTSVPEAQRSITAVEESLAAAAAGYACVRAFTSPAVRRILRERGEAVPGLTGALEALAAEGVRQVIVQPTYFLCGGEYDKLREEAETFSGRFSSLTVGRPLLSDSGDVRRFALRLSQAYPAAEGAASVFMGHGTGRPANAVYPALQAALGRLGREDLYVGTVKGSPALEDILRHLEPGGARQITLLPLLLVAGAHARNDMAGVWKPRLEQAGHRVTCTFRGLGELDWVREMYRERLQALL